MTKEEAAARQNRLWQKEGVWGTIYTLDRVHWVFHDPRTNSEGSWTVVDGTIAPPIPLRFR